MIVVSRSTYARSLFDLSVYERRTFASSLRRGILVAITLGVSALGHGYGYKYLSSFRDRYVLSIMNWVIREYSQVSFTTCEVCSMQDMGRFQPLVRWSSPCAGVASLLTKTGSISSTQGP